MSELDDSLPSLGGRGGCCSNLMVSSLSLSSSNCGTACISTSTGSFPAGNTVPLCMLTSCIISHQFRILLISSLHIYVAQYLLRPLQHFSMLACCDGF